MNVELRKENDILYVKASGRIDSVSAEDFRGQVIPALEGVSKAVFDFEKVEYISSAGLRVLLEARKKFADFKDMIIRNAREDIYDVFDITGFADIICFEREDRTQ